MPVIILVLTMLAASPPPQEIEVVPLGHASLMLKGDGRVIYIDPVAGGRYEGQPLADLILITHSHGDHLDLKQIAAITKPGTVLIGPPDLGEKAVGSRILANGETAEVMGIGIQAVSMYNVVRGPAPGKLFHPKGQGNGYVITLCGKRIYIAGDTECTPEMQALKSIDMAFIPMNLPYTMTPEEAADCVNAFRPAVVYPYHHRGSDLDAFKRRVEAKGAKVKILDWYP